MGGHDAGFSGDGMKQSPQSQLVPLLLIILLLLSLGTMWILFSEREEVGDDRLPADESAQATAAREKIRAPAKQTATGSDPPAEESTDEPRERLPLKDRGVRAEQAHFIEGIVRDARTAQPVKGAVVYSATDAGEKFGFDGDLETIPHVVTGRDGCFSLRTDHDSVHTLVAGQARYRESVVTDVRPAAGVEIFLHRGFTMRGRAFELTNEPLPEATVLITGPRAGGLRPIEHRVPTDRNGCFESAILPAGTYVVRLEEWIGHEAGSHYFTGALIHLVDQKVDSVRVGGRDGRGGIAAAIFSGKEPIEGVQVTAELVSPSREREIYGLPAKKITLSSDAEGRFGFYGLEPGRYRLGFKHTGGRVRLFDPRDVVVMPGAIVEEIFFAGQSRVEGRFVHYRKGSPIRGGGTVDIVRVDGKTRIELGAIEARGDGTFEIAHLAKGDYVLYTAAPGFEGEVRIHTTGHGVIRREVDMAPIGLILATVRAARPVEPSEVLFQLKEWIAPRRGDALRRDELGRYVIDVHQPSATWLRCTCLNEIRFQKLTAPRGETLRVSFEFGGTAPIHGHLLSAAGPVENCEIRLNYFADKDFNRQETVGYRTRTDSMGRYSIEVPQAGYYSVDLHWDDVAKAAPWKGSTLILVERLPWKQDLHTAAGFVAGIVESAVTGERLNGVGLFYGGVMSITDQQGRYLFRNVSEDPSRLYVYARGYPAERGEFGRKRFRVGDVPKTISLGREGCTLELILGGLPRSSPLLGYDFESELRVSRRDRHRLELDFIRVDEKTWVAHGLPEGKASLELYCRALGRKHKGRAKVELKGDEKNVVEMKVR